MSDYLTTIGIEVHAELKTQTKMFCDSKNDPDEPRPNWNICPVCTAQPGTLPTINKEAVWQVLRVGKAIGGTLADFSEFDRKNYFYPDLPKGYQISQYKYPLVSGGMLNSIAITRIHLEEDTARSQHSGTSVEASGGQNETLIDFNRAGIPLMELVTEPVVHSSKQAGDFARELQLLLRYLGASDANMEKGQMRVEANISVAPAIADSHGYDERIHADIVPIKLLYEELTYKIRGAVFSVYNKLGSGHKESVYQNALEEEFKRQGVLYEREKRIAVTYEDKNVGSYQPDFVIDGKIILELKALPFIGKTEKGQVRNYLRGSSCRLALLINFGSNPLHIERVIYDAIRDNLPLYPRISMPLGTKVEVKNINSFRAMERAIEYEIKRQSELLEKGEKVKQETRGWDEDRGVSFPQRSKENAHDYRYFPEPDLPKIYRSRIPAFSDEALRASLPELPWERRARYLGYGLKSEDVEMFLRDFPIATFFEMVIKELGNDAALGRSAANYIASDLASHLKDEAKKLEALAPKDFAELIKMTHRGDVSSRGAKDILAVMIVEKKAPREIAEEQGLFQKSDENELRNIAKNIIAANEKAAVEYKAGKSASLQYLVGQAMRVTKGAGNPQALQKLFKEMLQ